MTKNEPDRDDHHQHGGDGRHSDHRHDHYAEGHDHSGAGHIHAPANFGRAFAIGITLNTARVAAQALYGYLANSTALMADAGHNLRDVLCGCLGRLRRVEARAQRTIHLRSPGLLDSRGARQRRVPAGRDRRDRLGIDPAVLES